MSLPSTSAEALETAARLSGNPHNAREIQKLQAFALFAKDKPWLTATAIGTWEAKWEAAHPAGLDGNGPASWSVAPAWNRAAANRARRARKAAREAVA